MELGKQYSHNFIWKLFNLKVTVPHTNLLVWKMYGVISFDIISNYIPYMYVTVMV